MSYALFFDEDSLEDFREAFSYYQKVSPDLAEDFFQSFRNKINEIQKNPLHFQVRYRSIRIAQMKKFSFSVHFVTEEENIFVLKILHQKKYYS